MAADIAQGEAERAEEPAEAATAAYRRAGLTRAEAQRRAKVECWRAETQSPWEASPFGLLPWLLWRAVLKGFQPAWLIASLGLAAWFFAQWLAAAGGIDAVAAPPPGAEQRLRNAVAGAVPAGSDARGYWNDRLSGALDGDRRRRPDIDRFRSWAALGPDLAGRERLALDLLSGPAGPRELDARLRAGAPWEREARLDAAFRQALAEGEAAGLAPAELVFATETVRRRYAGSQFEWSVAASSADAFFRGTRRGEFEMRSLPGLVAAGSAGSHTRLYGGVRHLVIQACAHAPAALAGCDAPIVPAEAGDAAAFALAALEAGLVQMHVASTSVESGAETLHAARLAGRLSGQLEAWLAGTLPAALPPDRIAQELAATGLRADLAFAAPERAAQDVARRLDARTRPGAVGLSELLRDIARIRQATSPVLAIRLMDGLETPDDVRRMSDLAVLAGQRTLAVRELLGPAALGIVEAPAPAEDGRTGQLERNIMLALISAALVLLLTLIRLLTPPAIRSASRLSLADAWVSRLTLGRKT